MLRLPKHTSFTLKYSLGYVWEGFKRGRRGVLIKRGDLWLVFLLFESFIK